MGRLAVSLGLGLAPRPAGFTTSAAAALSAGSLAFDAANGWTTGQNPPALAITLPADGTVQVGDFYEIEYSQSSIFSTSTFTAWHQITSDDVINSVENGSIAFTWPTSTLATGLTYFRVIFGRGVDSSSITVQSAASSSINDTMIPPAPVLSSPTSSTIGSTTATVGVTTNVGSGTLYWFVSTSATPPTATALKAGTGAAVFGNQAVSATGAQSVSATGLTASTKYYTHFLHTDTFGSNSNIASDTTGYTTTSGVTFDPTAVFADFWDAGDTSSITGTGNTLSLANKGASGSAGAIIPHTTGTAFTSGDSSKNVNGLNTFYTDGSVGRMRNATAKAYSNTLHLFLVEYFDGVVYPAATALLFSMGQSTGTPEFTVGNNTASPGVVRASFTATGGTNGNCSTFPVSGTAVPAVGAHLWEVRADATAGTFDIYCDGLQRFHTTGWTGWGGASVLLGLFYQIASTNRASGRFCAAGIKDGSILSGTQLTDAQTYFKTRWGTP